MSDAMNQSERSKRYHARFPDREIFRHFCRRAVSKGVACMSRDEFTAWHKDAPKVCVYCAIADAEAKEKFGHRLHIERLEAAKGYVSGNVGYACQRCNFTKNNYLTSDQMKIVAAMFFGGPHGNAYDSDQRKIKALKEALLLDKTASVLGVCPASMLVFREAGYTGEANGGQMGKFVRDKKHAALALANSEGK